MRRILPVILVSLMAAGANAQPSTEANYPGPQPVPMPPAIPAPQDIAYPGATIPVSRHRASCGCMRSFRLPNPAR
jgi:hypothetical protein